MDLFVDCRYGIAGDMMLAALIDLGADISYIKSELAKLPIENFSMDVISKNEKGITASYLVVELANGMEEAYSNEEEAGHTHHRHSHKHSHVHEHGQSHHHHHHEHTHFHVDGNLHHQHSDHEHHHSHHHAKAIIQMIESSQLPDRVKARSVQLFTEIARAEGKIHGLPIDDVHFHEVGAMDSIIDIIGVCLALENLGVEQLVFNKPAVGHGWIEIAHGLYPIPAPATAEILVGVPLALFSCEGELTTPTGAAFAKVLAHSYSEVPCGTIEKIGYGAGTKAFNHPNILRVIAVKK
ncbi:TPA: LarC family nickel insertion protein [Streptococcus suis]|nr:LarC family nickel insertion protein [Streptococcus suis]